MLILCTKKLWFAGLLMTLALGHISCDEYSPSGTNFIELDKTPQEGVFYFIGYEDTLFLTGKGSVQYHISVPRKTIHRLDFKVGNNRSQMWRNGYTPYSYDFRYEESRIIPIEVVATISTETGSLEDQLNIETTTLNESFTLVVDQGPLDGGMLHSALASDSGLTIAWEPTTWPAFEKYVVSSKFYNSSTTDLGEIRAMMDTTWHDPSFLGGTVEYFINIISPGGTLISDTISYTGAYPNIVEFARSYEEDYVTVKWTACKYPTNFGYYVIKQRLVNSSYDKRDTLFGIHDTVFTTNYHYYNGIEPIRIHTYPKEDMWPEYSLYHSWQP